MLESVYREALRRVYERIDGDDTSDLVTRRIIEAAFAERCATCGVAKAAHEGETCGVVDRFGLKSCDVHHPFKPETP